MTARHQYRAVGKSGERSFTVFLDSADEAGARLFFAQAFPGATLVSIALQPVDTCGSYEKRPT